MDVVEGLSAQRPCAWDCHRSLTLDQRVRAIECIYRCDDALRGWGYEPLYELHGDLLWKQAQRANDMSYRKVAVRFGECIYRRLVGSMVHEVIHAALGDTRLPNYGILFGLPYCVPREVPEREEEAFLVPYNFCEARAFVGVWILGPKHYGVDWDVRTARDVGTYCFKGGNALVTAPAPSYRAVAHIDAVHHAERYLRRARALEEEARAWFSEDNLAALCARIDEAAAQGHKSRKKRYPPAEAVARTPPRKPGRNEPCPCGSGRKVKACCDGRVSADAEQQVVR